MYNRFYRVSTNVFVASVPLGSFDYKRVRLGLSLGPYMDLSPDNFFLGGGGSGLLFVLATAVLLVRYLICTKLNHLC